MKGVCCVDWKQIKAEYITAESTSYRKLAEKYKIPLGTLYRRAKKENWVELRKQSVDKTVAKTVEKIENAQVGRLTRIHAITDKALDKLEFALENVDALDTYAFRQIVATIKDIKEIQMLKSATDLREQEARIAKLERDAQADDNSDTEIRVVIEGSLEDYSK
jgi:hypothetical protein